MIVAISIFRLIQYYSPIKYDKNGLFKRLDKYSISSEGVKFQINGTKIIIKEETEDDSVYKGKVTISHSNRILLLNNNCHGSVSEGFTDVYVTDSLYILSYPDAHGEVLYFYALDEETRCWKELDYYKPGNLEYNNLPDNLQFNNIKLVDGKIVADAYVVSYNDGIEEIKYSFTFNGELHAEVISIKKVND